MWPDGDELYEIEVFVAELDDGWYLEVESSVLPAQAGFCRAGFELIRDSMRAE